MVALSSVINTHMVAFKVNKLQCLWISQYWYVRTCKYITHQYMLLLLGLMTKYWWVLILVCSFLYSYNCHIQFGQCTYYSVSLQAITYVRHNVHPTCKESEEMYSQQCISINTKDKIMLTIMCALRNLLIFIY